MSDNPTTFTQNSRIFIDVSALLAAGSSSDALNHFLDDLLERRADAQATIMIAESTLAELDALSHGSDEIKAKASRRVLGSLLNCVKAEEMHAVTTPKGQRFAEYVVQRVRDLSNGHPTCVVANDSELAGAIYQAANETSSCYSVDVFEVSQRNGACTLSYVPASRVLPTLEPESYVTPVPITPTPLDDERLYDEAELEHEFRRRKIDSLIQLAEDDELPELVRDDQGHIKVPHE